jgi:hypothetical protein
MLALKCIYINEKYYKKFISNTCYIPSKMTTAYKNYNSESTSEMSKHIMFLLSFLSHRIHNGHKFFRVTSTTATGHEENNFTAVPVTVRSVFSEIGINIIALV